MMSFSLRQPPAMTTTTIGLPQDDRIDWSGLPGDLLRCVFQLLGVHGRICFLAVCRSWRAAAADHLQDQQRVTLMPPPWVVIPEDIGCSKSFTLFSVPSQQGLRWTPRGGAGLRCVSSNGGWLAGAYIDADRTVRISLTNAAVEVPAIGRVSFMPHHERHKSKVEVALSAAVHKVAFSANPTKENYPDRLDVAYHDGKFYYITVCAQVWVLDMAAPSPSPAPLARFKPTLPGRVIYNDHDDNSNFHLGFSSDGALHVAVLRKATTYGESLNMFRHRYGPTPSSSQAGSSEWTPTTRLRGEAFLAGNFNQTLCVPAGGNGAWLRPHSVYFTGIPLCSSLPAMWRGVRVFNLATGYAQPPTHSPKIR